MIVRLSVVINEHTNPHRNLAMEEWLLHNVAPGECILYLWQNEPTVVIGRNQSALQECNIDALKQDSIHLARRLSGGGAVYHDLGNINFTFVARNEDFDVEMQTKVILHAMQNLGFHAEKNGRNDLEIDGKKFSGHAYYHARNASYHHGTIMFDVSTKDLSAYLRVSPLKLSAKHVTSVVSRVCNLRDISPDVSIGHIQQALVDAFQEVYGMSCEIHAAHKMQRGDKDIHSISKEIDQLYKKYVSDVWRMGDERISDYSREAKFDWGIIRIDFSIADASLSDGTIFTDVCVWSDMLDADYPAFVASALQGALCTYEGVHAALLDVDMLDAGTTNAQTYAQYAQDIGHMFEDL